MLSLTKVEKNSIIPHMHEKVDETIKLIIDTFSKTFDDFQGLYLFGIFADGKFHEGEDIELIAIFDVENKYKREAIWPIVGKIETDLDVCIDLYPMTLDDLKKDEELFDEAVNNGVYYKK